MNELEQWFSNFGLGTSGHPWDPFKESVIPIFFFEYNHSKNSFTFFTLILSCEWRVEFSRDFMAYVSVIVLMINGYSPPPPHFKVSQF